jgi:Flp pilus assembly protein TadD
MVGIRARANRLHLLRPKTFLVLLATTIAAHAAPPEKPTWRTHIAPIVYARCTTCHHSGGSGPFPLTTYADVKRYASVIAPAVESRYMPPWLPVPGHGDLADSRRLSDSELALIRRWIAASTPEGDGPIPTAPTYNADWQLGPPDLVLETENPVEVPATGTDLFVNVILPNPTKGTHWVRAMEIKPGSPRIVHHANVLIDRTASLRHAHPADWQQGIPGMDINVDSGDNFDPDSHFLFWKPDSTALIEPEGMPWRLDEGNDLVLNLHLKPSGKPESTRVRIGLYFTDKPATRHPMLLQLQHDAALDIPPGDASFSIEDSLKLPVAVDVLGIYPHAHYLCKRMEAWATLPSGQRRDLVLITDWDINRQSVYRLAHPLPLPAGSVLHMRYLYDNSAANPRNPHTPPVRVRAGNRSEDEMGHFWIQVLPHPSPTMTETQARESLERAWMESVLRKSPQDAIALYNLASLDLAAGEPARAADRYRKLLVEKPDDPRTLTALGSALEASGDLPTAQTQFRAAHTADPTYADATFDLATLDLRLATAADSAPNADANLTESESLFIAFLAAHPSDSEAEHQLSLLYATEGRLPDALTHLQRWQNLAPTDPEPHRALAQVYMQLEDLPNALREQAAVVKLLPNSSNDWSDLGVMQARSGDKPSARHSFEQALRLDPTNQAARGNITKLN